MAERSCFTREFAEALSAMMLEFYKHTGLLVRPEKGEADAGGRFSCIPVVVILHCNKALQKDFIREIEVFVAMQ